MQELNVVDAIVAKRDGDELDEDTVRALIDAYTRGDVPDYQMSAFLMAAFLRGMSDAETFAMTDAMLRSGTRIDLSSVPGSKVGKHSTGGVGDKVSLILAPVVAACGVRVPKVSGRGLGFTGGTVDKLESIPGFRTSLTVEEYTRQIGDLGLALAGQTDAVAPADKALYALRDVTGTVDFIPFIASSIMSKKMAEGIDALVLDVKCGRGAFMKDLEDARRLAESLADIGERMRTRTSAWVTRMDVPLGRAVGNWPEVVEAVQVLQGADVRDVTEIVHALAAEMILLGGAVEDLEEGRAMAARAVDSGAGFDKFKAMVEAQGGDGSTLDHPEQRPGFDHAGEVTSLRDGFVKDIDALAVGRTAVALGAGRRRKDEAVDPLAGIVLNKKPGSSVKRGETLARIYTKRTGRLDEFIDAIAGAFEIRDQEVSQPSTRLIDRFADQAWQGVG